MTLTRPAANRDTLSLLLFLVAFLIFVLGAFGLSPFGTTPVEWQSAGLAFFVAAALV